MGLKRGLAALVLLVCYSYSYSEIITGQTPNATKDGASWVMTEILPAYTGLTVGSVSYRYTAVKVTADPMVVNVQNYNALGSGYIFRSKDDWTGLPGNSIIKTVPTDNIPIQYWGKGEINIEGKGEVINPYVIYNYRYDTCFGSITTDPKCPNYKPSLPEFKYNESTDDEFVTKSLDRKTVLETEEILANNESLKKEKQSSKNKSSIIDKTIKNSLLTAEAAAQLVAFESLNNIPGLVLYSKAIPGGVYQETLKYVDKVLPDSRNGLRLNLSQERLHNKLIDLQYRTKTKDQND